MRRVFKTRYFSRWMRKTNLVDEALCVAVSELEALQNLAVDLLRLDMKQLGIHVNNKSIQEICLDDEN